MGIKTSLHISGLVSADAAHSFIFICIYTYQWDVFFVIIIVVR